MSRRIYRVHWWADGAPSGIYQAFFPTMSLARKRREELLAEVEEGSVDMVCDEIMEIELPPLSGTKLVLWALNQYGGNS